MSLVAMRVGVPSGGAAWGQAAPQSGEFQINTYTPLNQTTPAIAADGSGNFVVAWEQQDATPAPNDIIARRFNSTGAGLGPEFQVNVYTIGTQRNPWVGRSSSGGFVVMWTSNGQDGDGYGVFARRFSSAGVPQASEFQVNSYTTGLQSGARLSMGSGGDFVVVWHSYGQDGDHLGVFGRRFDSSGGPLASEFQVNTYVTGDQGGANVFRKSDNSFIVTWASDGQDGDAFGAFARRFDSGGSPIGDEFQLNLYTAGDQSGATIAYFEDGFGAAWSSDGQDGSGTGVFARGFSSDGVGEDGELQINGFTANNQSLPSLFAVGARHFVVVWHSDLEDGSSYGVFGRTLDLSQNGNLSDEFLINQTTFLTQRTARAAATAQRFVVVWQSAGQDGSNNGIFGRRFVIPLTLDVDGDGDILPLTDGLLTLRYEFGFRGSVLITAAVGAGCTRCDATSIEAYLGSV